ncbi:DNA-3-methyladenine glycosylase I [Desulfovibrio sp. OttesenSCG-928-F07]|nr:DNA-3-methyladenine glycosylase I [Desulfovibrio sp. OttesenSCG-928-F07]
METKRCTWATKGIMQVYHDTEWGVPVYDDKRIFEFLTLESAQAGLSWLTILNRREGYRNCFCNFDPLKVAAMGADDVERLMQDSSIIRNRKKIESAISNARIFCEMAAKHGTFSSYIWDFVDGKPLQNKWKKMEEVPALTPLAEKIAKELKKHGFKFLGPTVMYAHMQAGGMVNDHLVSCFRHAEVKKLSR